ncbi:hypothetical protein [Streptomyces sp. NPDC057257]|uniref:hypothetical protein n=1 Tax=Streptomyces sp. NPDC057257 TaxID=3346071 RepID=UPI00363433ED
MRDTFRIAKAVGAIVFTIGGVLGAASTAQAAGQSAQSYAGCDDGYVCLYVGASWNNNSPEHTYYTYGVHKLYDEYGTHRWFNNQTGSATTRLCVNSDGTNCTSKLLPYNYTDIDLTPYNSIRLDPS